MPITPFHFGPGFLIHAAAPRRVSFIAFAAANCITDVETTYNILAGRYPYHAFLHTFLGAAVSAALTVALFLFMHRLVRRTSLPNWFGWQELTVFPVTVGAVLGSYSHVVLDGIMHADMRPLAPWSDDNPFLHLVSLDALHLGCVGAAVVGGLLWLMFSRRKPRHM